MANVNLDALIIREDFEVVGSGDESPRKQSIQISELENDAFFYNALRKPDFQRETSEWNPARVALLIRTFIENDLIPGIILWMNKELLFVIDGSHRLSALIAWVHDDYGDGDRSQKFFNYAIPQDQLTVAKRTREAVEKNFGSYADHKKAIADPTAFGPEIVARARRFGSLSLALQWVSGDFNKAQNAFIRINQQAVTVTPAELELIENRKQPNAIAARAVIRRGTGHQYWSSFESTAQEKIKNIATELHELVFEPELSYPIKSLDLPAGGGVYSSTALRMIYDFIGLCVTTPSKDSDLNGQATIDYLSHSRRVMQMVLSNHPSSLGLHPAVYFYSWTGKQQPILFLTMVALLIDLERSKKLPQFIEIRGALEEFLINNRPLLNQVVRKFGTKESGTRHLRQFYDDVIEHLRSGSTEPVFDRLRGLGTRYSYLQPEESPYDGVAPTKFSTQVKSGLVIRELLPTAMRCAICNGYIPSQAISVDHKQRREDGGLAVVANAQLTHPYCNTGYREQKHAKEKAAKK